MTTEPAPANNATAADITMTPLEDAALRARFESGQRASIEVGPGWHRLLVRLDSVLSTLAPNYQILQIKEKFGGLRFYFSVPRPPQPACCQNATDAHRAGIEMLSEQDQESHRAYEATHAAHTIFHKALSTTVHAFEALSYTICEICAEPGSLDRTNRYLRTTCDVHRTLTSPDVAGLVWTEHENYCEASEHPRFRIYPNRGGFELCVGTSEQVIASFDKKDRAQSLANEVHKLPTSN